MIFGGHFENMQIRPLRRHFSACQHWFSDSAYQINPNHCVKPLSSQNACTCYFFLIFFPDQHNKHETPGRRTKQSNQLCLPHRDDCKTGMYTK